jgi:hypothetical protein
LMVDGAIDFRHGAPNWIHHPRVVQ